MGGWEGITVGARDGKALRLEIAGLYSFFSGVAQGERGWAGVGILTSSQLSATKLEFLPGE